MVTLPKTMVHLGRLVELHYSTGDQDFVWMPAKKNTVNLYSSIDKKTLWIFAGKETAVNPKSSKQIKQAETVWRKWSEFEPDKYSKIAVGKIDPKKIFAAEFDHIVYESDKWTGKPVEYIHFFDAGKVSGFIESSKSPKWAKIEGARITARGIEG